MVVFGYNDIEDSNENKVSNNGLFQFLWVYMVSNISSLFKSASKPLD